jgi:hypothetical protein
VVNLVHASLCRASCASLFATASLKRCWYSMKTGSGSCQCLVAVVTGGSACCEGRGGRGQLVNGLSRSMGSQSIVLGGVSGGVGILEGSLMVGCLRKEKGMVFVMKF